MIIKIGWSSFERFSDAEFGAEIAWQMIRMQMPSIEQSFVMRFLLEKAVDKGLIFG
jgi:hypothetical protein